MYIDSDKLAGLPGSFLREVQAAKAAKAIKAADTIKAVASLERQLVSQKKTAAIQQKIIVAKTAPRADLMSRIRGLPRWAKAAGVGAGVLLLVDRKSGG